MFSFIKKLMLARQLKMEEGSIEMLGQKMVLAPAYTFACMIKNAKDVEETGRFIYSACKHVNCDPGGFTYRVSRAYGLSGGDLIRWMANIATSAGWGKIKVIKVDEENKTAVVHIEDSPISKILGESKFAVDHPIRGYMAGAAEVVFNGLKLSQSKWVKYDYLETRCTSKGNSLCEFILGERNKLKNSKNVEIRKLYEIQVGV